MIAIVDYNAGNLTSVKRALDYLGLESVISPDPKVITEADRVIFPGVGHAKTSMEVLKKRGLDEALRAVFDSGKPLMGICLGTQIILAHSEEGDTKCLGLIEGNVPKFNLKNRALKVPHMGWNAVNKVRDHFILKDLQEGDEFYFVHSFYPQPSEEINIFAQCEYEITFAAAIGCRNLFATQFHPEKSGKLGLQLLKNFAKWDGTC